jgi:broad specificity phosphatase PhoE
MILLRHGQSEFNVHFSVTRIDPGIVDPRLTELGHQQARDAAQALKAEPIRRIIASPYWRALETAAPIAAELGLPVEVSRLVCERYAYACDVGSPRTALGEAWPQHDFSVIDEVWWPPVEEPISGIVDRAARFRAERAAMPDWEHTLVISHWGFILAMTGQSLRNGQWLRCDPTRPAPTDILWKHH